MIDLSSVSKKCLIGWDYFKTAFQRNSYSMKHELEIIKGIYLYNHTNGDVHDRDRIF